MKLIRSSYGNIFQFQIFYDFFRKGLNNTLGIILHFQIFHAQRQHAEPLVFHQAVKDFVHDPSFAALPGRPDCDIMTAFFRAFPDQMSVSLLD